VSPGRLKTDNRKDNNSSSSSTHNPKYPIQSNLMRTIQNLAAATALKTTKLTIEAFIEDLKSSVPDADINEHASDMLSAVFLSSHSFLKHYIKDIEVQADIVTSAMIVASQGMDPMEMEWGMVAKTAEKIVDESDAERESKEGK
jgi:esterase/lipase